MKNNNYLSRQSLFRWLLLCWLVIPWTIQAQNATHITSDSQVGCRIYRGDKEEQANNGVSSENIGSSQCVQVCAGSTVIYKANGQNILSVQWSAAGGTVGTVSGPGNTTAQISWNASPGNGSVQALITYANGTTENQTLCIEKINSPIADFKMLNLDYSVCKGTLILFDNVSQNNGGSDIVSYFWDFGDGTTSTAFEPSHAYAQSGNYSIKLTVTNKCGCSSTTGRDIEVLQSTPVQINCASVVCEGSVEKYSVQDGCKDGEWKAIGGTIVANNGNEIEVKWDQVDPADGFGYIMYRSSCGCQEWTTIKIPVILSDAKIQGLSTVCTGTQYKYSLPQWPTTNFQWNMSGPSGQLIYNQQRNEVIFQASQPGTYTLWCSYLNTLLLCEGYASMTITVENPVTVSGGADEICAGSSQTFTAAPNIPVVWTVTSGSTVVYTSGATTQPFNYLFSNAGYYSVTAKRPGSGCESNARMVKVLPIPAAPAGTISGDNLVCTGKPYVYTLNAFIPATSNTVPVWSVTGGTIQGSNTGSSVTVIFNAGASNYSVSVRNRSAGTAACLSAPLTKTVTPINLNTITVNPTPGTYCPSSSYSFALNLNGIVPDTIEWYFDSPNFGSFANGQGTSNITVNFNEISSTSTSVLRAKITKCGTSRIIAIPVALYTLPVVSFTNVGSICLGSNLVFTVNQGGIAAGIPVTFTFANGSTYTTTSNGSGQYTIPNNGYIQNTSGSNISQTVTVTYTGANGCNYKPAASAVFTVFPQTFITISPVYNLVVCDPSTMAPYTLTANSSTGLTNTVGWKWFRNGVQVGTGTTYTLSGAGIFGTYYVEAIDQNQCVVRSPEVKVIQNCSTSSCTANPQISFNPTWTGCNTISVNNVSFAGTPDEIQWASDSVLTLVSGQGTLTPVYSTTLAAAHIVFLRLRYGSCWYTRGIEVQKKYEPKFNVSTTCNGNGYQVTLHNSSTIFNINGGTINYSFSGGGQAGQSGQTAVYNLQPGTYTFTMTMVASGYPPCTTTQTITLAPLPSVNFAYPSQACVGEVINLQVPGAYSSANVYTWIFDNTSYVTSASTAKITYNNIGPNKLQLKIRTPNGCEFISLERNIIINGTNFSGSVQPSNFTGCAGSPPVLSFSPQLGSPAPSSYIWMNGSQQVSGAPNSSTFTPTQSGMYWPVLVDATGCKSYVMSIAAASVSLLNPPYVNISAKANICAGQAATLTGIVTDSNIEYRWGVNGAPTGAWTAMSSPAPIVYTTGGLAAGTYTYTLQVRPTGTSTGCIGSKTFTLTVSNPPAAPSITYNVQNCQPYEVVLTASGPSAGTYNWSNGMVGQSIVVNEGGAYQVTYTAPSGCQVSRQVQIPLSLESLMWVFPTGCYDECREKRYILGPKGIFDSHDWLLFGNSIQGGNNNYIYPMFLSAPGTYQLDISNFGCHFTSGPMNYYPGKECGIEIDCKLDAHIEGMRWMKDHFAVYGVIQNYGSQPISLTISSLNGYGSYIPSLITIPAGGSYDLFANPLTFYPNASFPGGADEILLDSGNGCKTVVKVEVPDYIGKTGRLSSSVNKISESALKIFPNPAKEKALVSFNTGDKKENARQIQIFDARGNIKYTKELKSSSGEIEVRIDDWLQGVYIVIVHTDGKPLQGKLIKK